MAVAAASLKSGGPEAAGASLPPPPPSGPRPSADRARPTTSGGRPLTWETPSRQRLVGCWTETWRRGLACLGHEVHSRRLRTRPGDSPAVFGVLCQVWAPPSPPPSRALPHSPPLPDESGFAESHLRLRFVTSVWPLPVQDRKLLRSSGVRLVRVNTAGRGAWRGGRAGRCPWGSARPWPSGVPSLSGERPLWQAPQPSARARARAVVGRGRAGLGAAPGRGPFASLRPPRSHAIGGRSPCRGVFDALSGHCPAPFCPVRHHDTEPVTAFGGRRPAAVETAQGSHGGAGSRGGSRTPCWGWPGAPRSPGQVEPSAPPSAGSVRPAHAHSTPVA